MKRMKEERMRELLRRLPAQASGREALWKRIEESLDGLDALRLETGEVPPPPAVDRRATRRRLRAVALLGSAAAILFLWPLLPRSPEYGSALLEPEAVAALKDGELARLEARLEELEEQLAPRLDETFASTWWHAQVRRADLNLQLCRRAQRANPLQRNVNEALLEATRCKIGRLEDALELTTRGNP